MKVLQITVHLFPNIGGVETHLNDLFNSLIKRGWEVFALAYQPLSTKTNWNIFEKDKNSTILRIPWIRGFFEKLINFPSLEFVYLVPGLFFVTPFVILFYQPQVLHAHGLSAAVSAVFWGKVFKIRRIISLHSIYSFPKKGLYSNFVKLLFRNCDTVLSLSKKSNEEIEALGVVKEKIKVFTYWIDLEKFKAITGAKEKLKWKDRFVVLFVGRLIKEKGLDVLLESVKTWNNNIKMVIIGSGPLEQEILRQAVGNKHIQFLGRQSQADLPLFYSAADCLIIPSTSEEGFGRVIIEALACGTPVIAADRGGIPEAMDETVGRLIDVTPEKIKDTLDYFYNHPEELNKLSRATRKFVERRYSESNAATIIKAYTQ